MTVFISNTACSYSLVHGVLLTVECELLLLCFFLLKQQQHFSKLCKINPYCDHTKSY